MIELEACKLPSLASELHYEGIFAISLQLFRQNSGSKRELCGNTAKKVVLGDIFCESGPFDFYAVLMLYSYYVYAVLWPCSRYVQPVSVPCFYHIHVLSLMCSCSAPRCVIGVFMPRKWYYIEQNNTNQINSTYHYQCHKQTTLVLRMNRCSVS